MKNTNYLERIAIALETLVGQGNYLASDIINDQPEEVKEVKEVEEVKEVKEGKAYTHEDLKNACLVASRTDTKNRTKIKALLKTVNAIKAIDVPIDKIESLIIKIESGDF